MNHWVVVVLAVLGPIVDASLFGQLISSASENLRAKDSGLPPKGNATAVGDSTGTTGRKPATSSGWLYKAAAGIGSKLNQSNNSKDGKNVRGIGKLFGNGSNWEDKDIGKVFEKIGKLFENSSMNGSEWGDGGVGKMFAELGEVFGNRSKNGSNWGDEDIGEVFEKIGKLQGNKSRNGSKSDGGGVRKVFKDIGKLFGNGSKNGSDWKDEGIGKVFEKIGKFVGNRSRNGSSMEEENLGKVFEELGKLFGNRSKNGSRWDDEVIGRVFEEVRKLSRNGSKNGSRWEDQIEEAFLIETRNGSRWEAADIGKVFEKIGKLVGNGSRNGSNWENEDIGKVFEKIGKQFGNKSKNGETEGIGKVFVKIGEAFENRSKNGSRWVDEDIEKVFEDIGKLVGNRTKNGSKPEDANFGKVLENIGKLFRSRSKNGSKWDDAGIGKVFENIGKLMGNATRVTQVDKNLTTLDLSSELTIRKISKLTAQLERLANRANQTRVWFPVDAGTSCNETTVPTSAIRYSEVKPAAKLCPRGADQPPSVCYCAGLLSGQPEEMTTLCGECNVILTPATRAGRPYVKVPALAAQLASDANQTLDSQLQLVLKHQDKLSKVLEREWMNKDPITGCSKPMEPIYKFREVGPSLSCNNQANQKICICVRDSPDAVFDEVCGSCDFSFIVTAINGVQTKKPTEN